MLIDDKGKPVLSKNAKFKARIQSIKQYVKENVILVFSVVGVVAVAVSNLSAIGAFIEQITPESYIQIPVEVTNTRNVPVDIDPLLDLHISKSLFFVGRLVGGEQPTDRLSLESDQNSSSYKIEPDSTVNYFINLSERRYSDVLSSGAANGIFVLHIKGETKFRYIEEKFHPSSLGSTKFVYSVD